MARQNSHNANTITGPQYAEPGSREMPWHVMGKALAPTHTTNLGKALKSAGMDFTVDRVPFQVPDLDGTLLDADRSQGLIRPMPDGTRKLVGITGTRFTPIANADAFSIATDLVGDFGAKIAGLADFRHGGASIMVLALPEQSVALHRKGHDDDVTELNLLVKNHHDGSGALTFALTPLRVPCTNVLPMALRGAKMVWKVNHTPNAMERVELIQTAIREAVGAHAALETKGQAMLDTKMVDAEFAKIVARMFPVKDDATGAVADRKREAQGQLMSLYRESPTLDGVRGTVWGGYNAVTEYLDHFRPVRGGNALLTRAEGQIDGPNVRVKARMFDVFAKAA